MAHDDESIHAGLGRPHFAWAAKELADVGAVLRHHELLEGLTPRIKPHDGVAAPIAEPHGVLLVNVHGVRTRPIAGQLPLLPVTRARIVSPDLSSVPFAYPDRALRIRPHPPCTLTRRGR